MIEYVIKTKNKPKLEGIDLQIANLEWKINFYEERLAETEKELESLKKKVNR